MTADVTEQAADEDSPGCPCGDRQVRDGAGPPGATFGTGSVAPEVRRSGSRAGSIPSKAQKKIIYTRVITTGYCRQCSRR